jgi:hypothetical protein
MAKKFKHPNRETWLTAANVLIDEAIFKPAGAKLPKKLRVTCGWPSVRSMSAKNQRIGECWSSSASKDGSVEIIIGMGLDDPVRVLDVLVHEDVHGIVGNECGHKGPFATLARKVGLQGKLTATVASPELEKQLKAISAKLGPYPHARLEGRGPVKKQTTRMVKCECSECGYVARTTRTWLVELGAPLCPCNGEPMTAEA